MAKTKLYSGSFCWHGEDHRLYTQATSEAQAFLFLCRQLGERVGYSLGSIANYFRGSDKYSIREEIE